MKATFVCAQLASCLQSPFNAENARGTKTGTSILDTSRRAKIVVRCLAAGAELHFSVDFVERFCLLVQVQENRGTQEPTGCFYYWRMYVQQPAQKF